MRHELTTEERQRGAMRGGQATKAKADPDYYRRIGRKGAESTWSKYKKVPVGTSQYAFVCKKTNKIVRVMGG